MRYPTIEKVLSDAGQYLAVVNQYRVYEGDEDLPKVFPGEGKIAAQGQDLNDFILQLNQFMADEGVTFEDVHDGERYPGQEDAVIILLAEEGRVIEIAVSGLDDAQLDGFLEGIQK